jgi:hypothetical protein
MGENLYGKLGPGWITPGLFHGDPVFKDDPKPVAEVPPAPPPAPEKPKTEKKKPVFVEEPVVMPPPPGGFED